ncbi:hypothetical protein [uncultured Dysosmobacter sp.]|uniref:hypothetical protein n=1 Tax=uncultured Dysosmobacter sp. TaxID=2591384 RepID=UPI00262888E6|nr:hypothetical protein [uncultured Dysosmobacter sp.]
MNKKEIIEYLIEVFSDIDIHPRLVSEVVSKIVGSGYEAKFFALLVARLTFLLEHGANAINLHKEYECVEDGIYSMHVSSAPFNIRILYAFFPDGSPTLLLAFYERGGKKKTDYTSKIPTARRRFSERQKEYRNEK